MSQSSLIISAVILLSGYYAAGLRTKMCCESETMKIDCLEDQSIWINSVEYGRRNAVYCNQKNSWMSKVTNCSTITQSVNYVNTKCQHKKSCSIKADYRILGDPCLYVHKYLEVGYECNNADLITKFTCEWQSLNIACPTGKKIAINEATYGRTDPTKCLAAGEIVNTNLCRAANSTDILTSRCDGKQTCTTPASNQLFGNPCPWIRKFLEVKYVCY